MQVCIGIMDFWSGLGEFHINILTIVIITRKTPYFYSRHFELSDPYSYYIGGDSPLSMAMVI